MNAINPRALQSFARSSTPNPELDDDELEDAAATEGDDRLQYLRPMVEMYGSEYDGFWDDLAPEVLENPDGTELDDFSRGVLEDQVVNDLDDKFITALQTVPDLTVDEARQLAEHASTEGLVIDAEGMTAWLFLLSRLVGSIQEQPLSDEGAADDSESDDSESMLA